MDPEREDYADPDRPQRRTVDWREVRKRLRPAVIPLLVVCLPFTCIIGFCAGWGWGEQRMHRSKSERDRKVLAPVLEADPAFSKVTIHSRDGGGVELGGEVPTTADGDRLRAAFVRLFGETQVWRITVVVRETGNLVPNGSDVPYTR